MTIKSIAAQCVTSQQGVDTSIFTGILSAKEEGLIRKVFSHMNSFMKDMIKREHDTEKREYRATLNIVVMTTEEYKEECSKAFEAGQKAGVRVPAQAPTPPMPHVKLCSNCKHYNWAVRTCTGKPFQYCVATTNVGVHVDQKFQPPPEFYCNAWEYGRE